MPERSQQFSNPYTHACNKCGNKFRSYETAVKHVEEYHPNAAGLLYSVKSKQSGGMSRVYLSQEAGLDPDAGKYTVVCEPHGTTIGEDSLSIAKQVASFPHNFCDDCRGNL